MDKLRFKTAEEGLTVIQSAYVDSEVVSGEFAEYLMDNYTECFDEAVDHETALKAVQKFIQWDAPEKAEHYYTVSGYWVDDSTIFEGYIVCEFDCFIENDLGIEEDDIFFYGLSKEEAKREIMNTEAVNDFVITEVNEL